MLCLLCKVTQYELDEGFSDWENADYVATSGELFWNETDKTTRNITIPILQYSNWEDEECFQVLLKNYKKEVVDRTWICIRANSGMHYTKLNDA